MCRTHVGVLLRLRYSFDVLELFLAAIVLAFVPFDYLWLGLLVVIILGLPGLRARWGQAPYVWTDTKTHATMLRFADIQQGETVYDLGCGGAIILGDISIVACHLYPTVMCGSSGIFAHRRRRRRIAYVKQVETGVLVGDIRVFARYVDGCRRRGVGAGVSADQRGRFWI